MIGRRALTLAAVLALTAAPPLATPAFAQKGGDAQAKFEAAQTKYDKKDFAGALPLFQDALAATGSPNARLYVARCLRETGQLAQAHAEFKETQRDAAER